MNPLLTKLTNLTNTNADAARLLFFLLQNETDGVCTVAWSSLISMQGFTPEKTTAAELELLRAGFLLSTTRDTNTNGCVFCHMKLSAQALSIIDRLDRESDREKPEPGIHTVYAHVNGDFMENCNRMLDADYEVQYNARILNSVSAYVTDHLLIKLSIVVPSHTSKAGVSLSIVENGEEVAQARTLYGPLEPKYSTVFQGELYHLCLIPDNQ